jgi:hypothetical protein
MLDMNLNNVIRLSGQSANAQYEHVVRENSGKRGNDRSEEVEIDFNALNTSGPTSLLKG